MDNGASLEPGTLAVASSVAVYRAYAPNERVTIRATRHGQLAHYTHDLSIGTALTYYGEHDWHDLEVTAPYARGVVIDIGANIGTHALVYGRTAERVLAFEPQISTYRLLVMNTILNCADNVIPYWCALGAENGMVAIPSYRPDEQIAWGGVDVGEGDDLVVMRTLDSIQQGPVSLLKIDVERSVIQVLEGAVETIQAYKPVIYLECNFGAEADRAITRTIETLGYSWERHVVPAFPPANYYGCEVDIYEPGCQNVNLLCLPK